MGITKLADLVRSEAPNAISHKDISDYSGKKIALDASIIMNQFRAALNSVNGGVTLALSGLFYRTLTLLEHDIKPVFVFDGKPPAQKVATLQKRAEADGRKFTNYLGFASAQTKNCIKLLELLGVPIVQAPGDAEALCAQLVKAGAVFAVASEDMDTLPFGANILIRQLNASKDSEVTEYSLEKLLHKLELTQKEFVDLCILLGCDYCDKIPKLGPKRALVLIQNHRTIEEVVLHVKRKTHPVPQSWNYKAVRKLFLEDSKTDIPEFVWKEPDEEGLVTFLSHERNVNEERVRNRLAMFHQKRKKLREEREKNKGCKQTRMEDFFRITRKRGATVDAAESSSSKEKRPKKTK
ncbi:probable flap endonuclease 1 homolog [Boleophthalmus pectinirostris]|uniref:probable flap endonuclease 1 homolog n=1 Tax=Boleophthalmus pectinirostris TaxID=150288 RepID=UPI0024318D1E|nr:probable flap endonuclease 1 homolog [Boleophthalmus pectinirostris]XP_020772922.2 probable flap endonuclease 1 homolog [Boleophthalmus pectinirostris]